MKKLSIGGYCIWRDFCNRDCLRQMAILDM